MPDTDTNSGGFVPPDGGYGWIVVLSTTIMNICLLPLVQNFGIIFSEEFKTNEIKGASTAFLLHLHTAIYCTLGLLASPLLKKYDFRSVALLGITLMCTGILLTSFVRTYTLLICTVSVLIGVGQGIFLPATYLATNTYFKKRLTLAVSFSVTGAAISSIFMPQLCTFLLKHMDRSATVRVLFYISLIAIVSCLFLRPIEAKKTEQVVILEEGPKAEEDEKFLNDGVYQETTRPKEKASCCAKIRDIFNLELLKNAPFVVTIIGMAVSFASELNIVVMIPFVLFELAHFTANDVAMFLSTQSIADIIGRMGIPLIGHYFNMSPRVMYGLSLTTSTFGRTTLAIFYTSRPAIFTCAALLGLAKGTKAVYQSVIIPRYVPLDKFSAANGLNMLLTAALSLTIGPIIGAIHDARNSYVYALHAGSAFSISCVVLWVVYYFIWERRTQAIEKQQEEEAVEKCKVVL